MERLGKEDQENSKKIMLAQRLGSRKRERPKLQWMSMLECSE